MCVRETEKLDEREERERGLGWSGATAECCCRHVYALQRNRFNCPHSNKDTTQCLLCTISALDSSKADSLRWPVIL